MDRDNIIKLICDYRNKTVEKYSMTEAKQVLREFFTLTTDGRPVMIAKLFRDHPEVYAIIEEVVERTVPSGLSQNDFFNNWVEVRNIREGDSMDFVIPKKSQLVLADISRGNQSIRRQRIGVTQTIPLVPTPKGIHLYEEMTRLASGRTDINTLIDAIIAAVTQTRLAEVFAAWNAVTTDDIGVDFFPVAGAYDEEALFDLTDLVSAANDGASCVLLTTPRGARKLTTGVVGEAIKDDFYNYGHTRSWNGIPIHLIPQRFKLNSTTEMLFNNNKVYVIPTTMDRPVKQVIGGDDMLLTGDPTDNSDLTTSVKYITSTATAVITGNKFGIYTML